jgi:glycosyltransferase involved in cell wall biosynthesis
VSFVGLAGQDEIPRFYMGADIFCVSSLGEGGPVVAMEAMALGLPVVATNTGGIPELVEDGVTGLLAPPGNSGLLADQIEQLARDPDLRHRLGAAGRLKITEGFDQGRWIDELWACFSELANAEPADLAHREEGALPEIGNKRESSQPSQPLVRGHE